MHSKAYQVTELEKILKETEKDSPEYKYIQDEIDRLIKEADKEERYFDKVYFDEATD